MKLAFSLLDWQARAPGLDNADQWCQWAQSPASVDERAALTKCSHLPMMAARRLNSGSRAAVDCGLALLKRQQVEAIVFTSRHGELERNLSILQALAQDIDLSPTDFAMSVHNAAAGSLTISAGAPLVASSLSAGIDSFAQGLVEVATLLHAGYRQVMLVDFDGMLPAFYHPLLPSQMPRYPYAVALVFTAGQQLQVQGMAGGQGQEPAMAQSLQFLHAWLAGRSQFLLGGERLNWHWARHHG